MGPIERYERRKQIGEGRSGVVFEAHDLALDREVALKLLHEGFSLEPGIKKQILSSGWAGLALSHPNIAALYDAGDFEGSEYVVSELLTGTDGGGPNGFEHPFSLLQKLDFMARICDGIAHAHRHGLLHLNIHPGNVFMRVGQEPKVSDFGIRSQHVAGREQVAEYCSLSAYAAPECLMGQTPDCRSDVYSLGLVFLEFVANVERADARDAPLPPSLQTLLTRATEKSPDDRIQTAQEFAVGMRSIEATLLQARLSPIRPGKAVSTEDLYKTFVPPERDSGPSSQPRALSGLARLTLSHLLSPASRKVGGVLLTAVLLLIFVVAVSETLKLRVKKVVAHSEVQVRTAALLEAPDDASRLIRSLRFGTPLDVLEPLSSKDQQFVHVQYISDDGDSVSGYLQTKDLGKWTSEDPETAWALLNRQRPEGHASPDEIRTFIDDLGRFRERFPQSPHTTEADLAIHRFTATLNQPEVAGAAANLPAVPGNGTESLLPAAAPDARPDQTDEEADKLLKRMPELWDNGDLDAVLALSNQILATAPDNLQARKWRAKANKALKELGGQ